MVSLYIYLVETPESNCEGCVLCYFMYLLYGRNFIYHSVMAVYKIF